MRRLSGVLLACAICVVPAFSHGYGDLFAQAAPQKTLFTGDVVIQAFAINPDKTADYEMVLAKLKDALSKSDAKWKIPFFHHPLYSSGQKHGSEIDLRQLVEPLFVEHGVDVVFSGHEHFYERMKPQKGIYYFTEGGSAKLREGNIRVGSALTEKGFDRDNTFMLVEINKDDIFFEAISRAARVVDTGSFPRREVTSSTSTR